MLQKRETDKEKQILQELIAGNPSIKKQHELFVEEMNFKQMLIDARKSMELTQKQVSEKSGLSQQAVSRLEKGHGGTIETVIRYLHAMGFVLELKKN